MVRVYEQVSDEELSDAMAAAALNDMSTRHDLDLDAPVGSKGASLSRGQRQRIALARTIVRKRKYMFFDEPTSSQDDTRAKVSACCMRNIKR